MSLQGRAERRKGLKVVRKVEIVERGMVILAGGFVVGLEGLFLNC